MRPQNCTWVPKASGSGKKSVELGGYLGERVRNGFCSVMLWLWCKLSNHSASTATRNFDLVGTAVGQEGLNRFERRCLSSSRLNLSIALNFFDSRNFELLVQGRCGQILRPCVHSTTSNLLLAFAWEQGSGRETNSPPDYNLQLNSGLGVERHWTSWPNSGFRIVCRLPISVGIGC